MNKDTPPAKGYGSASDLPSVVEMQELLRGGKLLTRLIARDQRAGLVEIEKQLNALIRLVDEFYALLGPRHWVFPDSLPTDKIEALIGLDPSAAERALIALYTPDQLRLMIMRLNAHPEMRPRLDLIRRALDDYAAGRYYATVLVLLTMMDGFVNDVDTAHRRGLHARNSDEMVAWDSVTGHHLGLAHAHAVFTKGTFKTTSDELVELQRNGILHGTQLNYDNIVVAAKAWNQLFAVADWATSLRRQAIPAKPEPTMKELLKQIVNNARDKEVLAAWKPFSLSATDDGFVDDPVVLAATGLMDAWRRKNYAEVAGILASNVAKETPRKTAGMVSGEYRDQILESYEIVSVSRHAVAAAEVEVTLTIDGVTKPGKMFWLFEADNGEVSVQAIAGKWKVVTWGPMAIYNRATSR